ncbi:hypothetical protein JYU23_00825 [bacterium AH-315-C07]|nr:hypothetical protein [bacterium AH-315-C07]
MIRVILHLVFLIISTTCSSQDFDKSEQRRLTKFQIDFRSLNLNDKYANANIDSILWYDDVRTYYVVYGTTASVLSATAIILGSIAIAKHNKYSHGHCFTGHMGLVPYYTIQLTGALGLLLSVHPHSKAKQRRVSRDKLIDLMQYEQNR